MTAAGYMKEILHAVNHCHAQNIVHRNVTPESIMILEDNSVRLISFELSAMLDSKKEDLNTTTGTPYYMAPEVMEGSHSQKADNWSIGVILYTLVSGYLPFQGESAPVVFKKIKEADYHFNHEEFKTVSDECKDLIRKLLVID